MRETTPHVYISLLNWNSPEQTIACLHQLGAQTYRNVTPVVVDNASRDDSILQIRSEFPELEIIAANQNLGYAAGHRLALTQALQNGADLIWLLNVALTFT